MEITGEFHIPAVRERVWDGLNDPEVLRQCIPGCESLEKISDTEFHAEMRARIGPVSARFRSAVVLSNLQPPAGYTISGEGKGGPAGFGKGSANVSLEEQGADTVLRYSAELHVGGKLAQIGSRLVVGATRKMADGFFSRFVELMAEDPAG